MDSVSNRRIDEGAALRAIIEGTASETGTEFFRELVKNLAHALDTRGAWVTEYDRATTTMRSLAFWFGDDFINDLEYDVTGTPCEPVVEQTRMVHIPDRIIDLYPSPPPPGFPQGEVSYLGVPLLDTDGSVMGHLAVVDVRPMPEEASLHGVRGVRVTRGCRDATPPARSPVARASTTSRAFGRKRHGRDRRTGSQPRRAHAE
jgi:hypothetical protein